MTIVELLAIVKFRMADLASALETLEETIRLAFNDNAVEGTINDPVAVRNFERGLPHTKRQYRKRRTVKKAQPKKRRRKMSAESRKRISEALRRRHAKHVDTDPIGMDMTDGSER